MPEFIRGPSTHSEMQDASNGWLVDSFAWTESEPSSHPDLVTVAASIPGGVVCLVSALAFHELTTQIPRHIDLALPKGALRPGDRSGWSRPAHGPRRRPRLFADGRPACW